MITAIMKTTEPANRPSLEEWLREFNVSSRYVESKKQPDKFNIDMDKLKISIRQRKVETVN